jgi:hypothetical protein
MSAGVGTGNGALANRQVLLVGAPAYGYVHPELVRWTGRRSLFVPELGGVGSFVTVPALDRVHR